MKAPQALEKARRKASFPIKWKCHILSITTTALYIQQAHQGNFRDTQDVIARLEDIDPKMVRSGTIICHYHSGIYLFI